MKNEIEVNGLTVQLKKQGGDDFISLTDIAKSQGENIRPADVIKTGLELELPSNSSELGSKLIIQILKWSNLTTLKYKVNYAWMFSRIFVIFDLESRSKTTEICTNVSNKELQKIISPFDTL